MAFPQVQSVTETTTSSATVHNIDMPATVNAGDLLLMFVVCSDLVVSSAPSGWTILRDSVQVPVYIKDAVGNEDGGTAQIGTSSSVNIAAQVYRITGWVDSGTILNDVELASTTGTSTSPNPPALNPSNWGIEDTLWVVAVTFVSATTTVTAYPANYTNGTATSAGNARLASARRELAADSENPGTFATNNTIAHRVFTVAIRPVIEAIEFDGSAEVSFDGTVNVDAVSDIVFAGSGALDFDGTAGLVQNAVFEGEEEVSFDGTANLSGGVVLLTGEGEVSFDGTALLNQEAIFEGFADVEMNGLARLGVIQEFAAQAALMFDGSASLSATGWQEVDVPTSQIWTVKK